MASGTFADIIDFFDIVIKDINKNTNNKCGKSGSFWQRKVDIAGRRELKRGRNILKISIVYMLINQEEEEDMWLRRRSLNLKMMNFRKP